MMHIHDNKVNKIYECNLLHGIINPRKRTKNLSIHYSPIIHGFIISRKGRANFNTFQILLESGCISIIIIVSLVEKLYPENML